MKIIVKNGYLAVNEIADRLKTKQGIELIKPIDSESQMSLCEVIADEDGSEYKVGDRIHTTKIIPEDALIFDKKGEKHSFWYVKEEDVRAIIEE